MRSWIKCLAVAAGGAALLLLIVVLLAGVGIGPAGEFGTLLGSLNQRSLEATVEYYGWREFALEAGVIGPILIALMAGTLARLRVRAFMTRSAIVAAPLALVATSGGTLPLALLVVVSYSVLLFMLHRAFRRPEAGALHREESSG